MGMKKHKKIHKEYFVFRLRFEQGSGPIHIIGVNILCKASPYSTVKHVPVHFIHIPGGAKI